MRLIIGSTTSCGVGTDRYLNGGFDHRNQAGHTVEVRL